MKVAIVGAGAMGGVYGGKLREAGVDVVLVDVSKALVEEVAAHGLLLRDAAGDRRIEVDATADPSSVGPVEVAIVFTKGYHTESALAFVAPLLGPGTVVTSLQNGWGNGDVIATAVPPECIVIGVSYNSALLLAPGQVAHTNIGPTVIGPYEGTDVRPASQVAAMLRKGGFEIEVTPEIRRRVWQKLVLNTPTLPVAALTRLLVGGMRGEVAWSLIERIARETIEIGTHVGFDLDPETELETIRRVLEGNAEGKASMLQDIEAGRRTEIDTINGAVVEIAKSAGVAAPLNETMFALVKEYERANGIV